MTNAKNTNAKNTTATNNSHLTELEQLKALHANLAKDFGPIAKYLTMIGREDLANDVMATARSVERSWNPKKEIKKG